MLIDFDLRSLCWCGRRQRGYGYAARRHDPITWACSPECSKVSARARSMAHDLDRYEELALQAGGRSAGAYLEEIGKTDLARLTPLEWESFLRLVLIGYADAMRELIRMDRPPF